MGLKLQRYISLQPYFALFLVDFVWTVIEDFDVRGRIDKLNVSIAKRLLSLFIKFHLKGEENNKKNTFYHAALLDTLTSTY